jgi:folate-dependent phosphoribosylglycinamide formyltransferase PurN
MRIHQNDACHLYPREAFCYLSPIHFLRGKKTGVPILSVKPLYEPRPGGPMRVACFVSGSGTNLVRILEHQRKLERREGGTPYRVCVIFTDNEDSKARKIGADFDLPVAESDIMAFYRSKGREDKKDMSLRPEYDSLTVALLKEFDPDFVALAGYMSVVTKPLLDGFDGRMINVHPADLRVNDGGKRRYTGDRAVAAAIRRGETSLRSSVHIVRAQVDYGEILAVSGPLPVELPAGVTVESLQDPADRPLLRRIADEHQDRLKERGDWVIYPRALEYIGRGRFGFDGNGVLQFDGRPAPEGIEIHAD